MPTLSDFSEFCIHAISSFLHELWGGNIVYSESKCRSVVINANILWCLYTKEGRGWGNSKSGATGFGQFAPFAASQVGPFGSFHLLQLLQMPFRGPTTETPCRNLTPKSTASCNFAQTLKLLSLILLFSALLSSVWLLPPFRDLRMNQGGFSIFSQNRWLDRICSGWPWRAERNW